MAWFSLGGYRENIVLCVFEIHTSLIINLDVGEGGVQRDIKKFLTLFMDGS